MAVMTRGWRYEVDVKRGLNQEDEPTLEGHKRAAIAIADILEKELRATDREELQDVIDRLREIGDPEDDYLDFDDTEGEINFCLDQVYDYADTARIWLGLL